MNGKRESDTKCYCVITGKQPGKKNILPKISHTYIVRKLFQCWSFSTERPWSENHAEKKYFLFSLALW